MIGILIGLWLAAVLGGSAALWQFSMAPGDPASPPTKWPTNVSIPLAQDAYTIVMLMHPRCSCSRASLAELAKIMTRLDGRAKASVLFLRPAGSDEDWEKTSLWSRAQAIPGVDAIVDDEGRLANLFGARTSGQTLLYDASGHLVFSGGITGGRAHEGDNVGESRLVSLVMNGRADSDHSSVYGCELVDPKGSPN